MSSTSKIYIIDPKTMELVEVKRPKYKDGVLVYNEMHSDYCGYNPGLDAFVNGRSETKQMMKKMDLRIKEKGEY